MALIFTGDDHFNHKGIITSCKRPFADVLAMREALVERWNEAVTDKDDVVHVGDFAWSMTNAELAELFGRLKGRKFLVPGNHDDKRTLRLPWTRVLPPIAEIKHEGETFVASHYPLSTWNKRRWGYRHVYGHVHGRRPGTSDSIDVGVDTWNYAPVTSSRILEVMATLPVSEPPDGLPIISYFNVEAPQPPAP